MGAQRAALGTRRPLVAADGRGRVSTRVLRRAGLSVVRERVARPIAAAHVERAVGPEMEVADRVAREVLASALEQRLRPASDVTVVGQAYGPSADHAPLRLPPWPGGSPSTGR